MRIFALLAALVLGVITAPPGLAQVSPGVQARLEYEEQFKSFLVNSNSPSIAWQFARACFDVGEYATNNAERALLAQKGIAAAELALAKEPKSAPAMYYLGMNLGQLARTRGIGALKVIQRMEQAFIDSRELDPWFDYGGSDRNLGLLYREAPSIISLGSRSKAKKHLEAAVQRAPAYPENRLNLIDSYLDWGDKNGAIREYRTLKERWAGDIEPFRGPKWDHAARDWQNRLEALAKRLEAQHPALKSPKGKI